jgi:DNA-binding response OmpR family regulator
MKQILLVEDDKAIQRGLVDTLSREHFQVIAESDGSAGYARARKAHFDLIILDVMLPGMDGFEICRKLRGDGIQTPVLMLTGKGEEIDKVLGLELGADDYVTKPFSIKELMARVRALLRRQAEIRTAIAETDFGNVHVDFKKQETLKGRKKVRMSAKEYELLKYFVEHEGEVITRHQLLDDVWGYDVTPTTRTVDNYVLSLRKKLEARPSSPQHFLTIPTAGYKFVR